MNVWLGLAFKSMRFRKATVILTIASIMISFALLISVYRLKTDARVSFQQTISNIDLVVGSKTGSLQLLMSTVFHQGFPSNNMSYAYFERLRDRSETRFAIPISLGDSHKGFRVIATNDDFFAFYQYADKQPLRFAKGTGFQNLKDVVLGAQVAEKFGYTLQDEIVISHGIGETSFMPHDDHPFVISGVLAPTGTPVDKGVYITLEAMELIHKEVATDDLTPIAISAAFVGVANKTLLFSLQREINTYSREALLAIIPTLTLYELWNTLSVAEKALWLVSLMVALAGMVGLLVMLLTSMRERRFEMAVLRSLGAHPFQIGMLFILESTLVTVMGVFAGCILFEAIRLSLGDIMQSGYGVTLGSSLQDVTTLYFSGMFVAASLVVGLIPAFQAMRNSLHKGLAK